MDETIVKAGRSVGAVAPPAVNPELPAISDEELQEALSDLSLVHLNVPQVKSLRQLGQGIRSSGVVSIGRGILLFTVGQLMDLAQEAGKIQDASEDIDQKHRIMKVRKDAAHELTVAATALLASDETKSGNPPPPAALLPAFGEEVKPSNFMPTQINTKEVHIHGR